MGKTRRMTAAILVAAGAVVGLGIGAGTAAADTGIAGGAYASHGRCEVERAAAITLHPFTDFGPCLRAGDVGVPYTGYESFGKWYFYYL